MSSGTIINTIGTLIYDEFIQSIQYRRLLLMNFQIKPSFICSSMTRKFTPNIFVSLDYFVRIYPQSSESFTINSMSYNMSLLHSIKLHQLPVSSAELCLNGEDIIWDNEVVERNPGFKIVYILKFPNYNDYNNMLVFDLRSNLSSYFFV
jgi:hypothetical protein